MNRLRDPSSRICATAVLVLAAAAGVHGHLGTGLYPVYLLPPGAIDLHDGTLQDWEEAVPNASIHSLEFPDLTRDPALPLALDDLAVRVFLGWSLEEQRIYVAVERFDDIYVNEYSGGGLEEIWRHDGIELYIDGDHSGGVYRSEQPAPFRPGQASEEAKRFTSAQAQDYLALPESPGGGRPLVAVSAGDAWVSGPPWADVGGAVSGQTPSLSVTELAVTPWVDLDWHGAAASARTQLRSGAILGLLMALPDYDTEPGRLDDYGYHTLQGARTGWYDASQFADAVLCGTGGCLPGAVSAVRQETWARIKAGLR